MGVDFLRGRVAILGAGREGTAARKYLRARFPDIRLSLIETIERAGGRLTRIRLPLIERLHAAGKAVYGMKVLGCGRLVEDAHAAIRYVLQLGTVHALTIGISRPEHLRQNARLVEELAPQYPLRVYQTA